MKKKPRPEPPAPRWLKRDGIRVDLSDMHDRHLQNTERYLRGGGVSPSPLQREPRSAEEAAASDVYGGRSTLLRATEEWHKLIRAELERRGLPLLSDHETALARNPPEGHETRQDASRGRLHIVPDTSPTEGGANAESQDDARGAEHG